MDLSVARKGASVALLGQIIFTVNIFKIHVHQADTVRRSLEKKKRHRNRCGLLRFTHLPVEHDSAVLMSQQNHGYMVDNKHSGCCV